MPWLGCETAAQAAFTRVPAALLNLMETEQSPLDQTRIIEAGLSACARMHFCIAQILKYSPPPDPTGRPFALVSHWEVAEAIEALCHAQATAFGCLFDDGRRPAWEKPVKKDYRLRRVAMVGEKCGDLDIPNLRNKGIRMPLRTLTNAYLIF